MSSVATSTRHRNATGLTLLELLVAMSLFGIMLGVTVTHMPRTPFALWGAEEQLVADLRNTRGDALERGDHFRLDVTGPTAYAEYRLALAGGAWTPSGDPVRSRTLPDGVTFTAGVGARFEFNTRGLLTTPVGIALELSDAHSGFTRRTTVWPSGQVMPVQPGVSS
jgi:prepilin-type N-terminal cleavage/methylation domain-containing protein